VANWGDGIIGEYNTSGSVVNASLITGLYGPSAIAISGNNLFVANWNTDGSNPNAVGTVGEYTTSGASVNPSLITGLRTPSGIAINGDELFVADTGNGRIGEYTTSGTTVNGSLISGLTEPYGIVVVPEPPSCLLAALWAILLVGCRRFTLRVS
jgi:hypothetical protein